MPSRTKRRFLVTAASVLAGVSLASAQALSGAASEEGTSAGQAGGEMSRSATGASRGEGEATSAFQRQSQSSPTGSQSSTTDQGQAGAAVDLSRDDIRVVQRVLIERRLLHGKADGILGPKTREAISAFQRQQGIQVTGSIDARTVSLLGVSGRLSQQANRSIGRLQSAQTGAQISTAGQGQAGAAVDLSRNDIRIVQRALIERRLLRGKADGILGPKTRKAVSAFQRQQDIQVTGSIDARTVSSLGISGRLSQQANQSIGRSQSAPTGVQTSTPGRGQSGTGQAQTAQPQPSQQNAAGHASNQTTPNQTTSHANKPPAQQSQPSTEGNGQAGTGQAQTAQPQPSQQNTTGQASSQTTGQASNSPPQQSQPLTTGQSTASNQSNVTGEAGALTQGGSEPIANENAPSGGISLTFTDAAAIGFLLLALGAFILVPAV